MSNNVAKMTTIEALCFVIIGTINRIVLNTPQSILLSCSSASILNIIYISIFIIIGVYLVIKLYKNFLNYDIIDISEFVGGKILKNIIGIILISYFILIMSVSIRNFAEILHVTYYTRTFVGYLIFFLVIVSIISNMVGEQAVIRTNVAATIIMLISLLITYASVSQNFVYQRIYPILGNGVYSTFFSGISNIFVFNGLICIYFLPPMLDEHKNFGKIVMLGTVIICILLFLSVVSLLLALAFSSDTEYISPLYYLITNNKFSNFMQHPESLFVFTWVLSFISYVNIVLMLTIRFLKKITSINNTKLFAISAGIMIFIVAMIPKNINDTHNAENFLFKYIIFPLTFVIIPIILIIANIKHKRRKNINESNNQIKTQ